MRLWEAATVFDRTLTGHVGGVNALAAIPGGDGYWIKAGHLPARRGPGNRLAITWTPEIETSCRSRITSSGHLNRPQSQPIPAGEAV